MGQWWREAMATFTFPFAFLVCYLPGHIALWTRKLFGVTVSQNTNQTKKTPKQQAPKSKKVTGKEKNN